MKITRSIWGYVCWSHFNSPPSHNINCCVISPELERYFIHGILNECVYCKFAKYDKIYSNLLNKLLSFVNSLHNCDWKPCRFKHLSRNVFVLGLEEGAGVTTSNHNLKSGVGLFIISVQGGISLE